MVIRYPIGGKRRAAERFSFYKLGVHFKFEQTIVVVQLSVLCVSRPYGNVLC